MTESNVARAHRRLYRDYLELQASPLPGINASPPDADNPWVWHASIRCEDRSSLRGNVQHASLTFPETYPDDPPTVRLLTTLHGHGNVFGDYLCMDMLRRQPGLYVGWSSAYSVSSVLLQLSSFLFAESMEQDYTDNMARNAAYVRATSTRSKENASATLRSCERFRCDGCEHTGARPWPRLPPMAADAAPPPPRPQTASSASSPPPRAPATPEPAPPPPPATTGDGGSTTGSSTASTPSAPASSSSSGADADDRSEGDDASAAGSSRGGEQEEEGRGSSSRSKNPTVASRAASPAASLTTRRSRGRAPAAAVPVANAFSLLSLIGDADIADREADLDRSHITAWRRRCAEVQAEAEAARAAAVARAAAECDAAAARAAAAESAAAQASERAREFASMRDRPVLIGKKAEAHAAQLAAAAEKARKAAEAAAGVARTAQAALEAAEAALIELESRELVVDLPPRPPAPAAVAVDARAPAQRKARAGLALRAALGIADVVAPASVGAGVAVARRGGGGSSAASSAWAGGRGMQSLSAAAALSPLEELPNDVMESILSRLAPQDLCALARSSRSLRDAVRCSQQFVKRELLCYHSRESYREAVLGVALDVEAAPSRSQHARRSNWSWLAGGEQHMGPMTGRFARLSSPLDLLSLGAFASGARRGVWGEHVNAWLPLALDSAHRAKAVPLALRAVKALANLLRGGNEEQRGNAQQEDDQSEEFWLSWERGETAAGFARVGDWPSQKAPVVVTPGEVLAVLPALLNSQVVAMMQATERGDSRLCEKALLGYCQFHHLFLHVAKAVPGTVEEAMRRLDEFIGEPHGRHKSRCPDLGHLLTLLALSSSPRHAWPRVAPAVLQEALARNVRWVFQAHPECEELQALLSSSPDAVSNAMTDLLLERTRDGSATSQRVLMFNAAFARLVARREGAAPGAVLAWYDGHFGRPSAKVAADLGSAARTIMSVSTWPAFYQMLGLACPTKAAVVGALRRAVARSAESRYHVPDWARCSPGEGRVRELRGIAAEEAAARCSREREAATAAAGGGETALAHPAAAAAGVQHQ